MQQPEISIHPLIGRLRYNRAVILYQSCRDISHKYIVLEKEPIKWKH